MAFWGRSRWLASGSTGHSLRAPVLPWREENIEAAGYRLSVGREVFLNDSSTETVRFLEKNDDFVIAPGQFAFILTHERVQIPKDAIGFISIRASIKFKGLVNVSGFQVNPGFRGNLVFAIFNAGPKHVHLRRGDEIFSIWIADLDQAVSENFEDGGKIPNNLDKIPSEVLSGISGESKTAYQLDDKIREMRKELDTIKQNVFYAKMVAIFLSGLVLFMLREQVAELYSWLFPSTPPSP